jgi:hypothetical protein
MLFGGLWHGASLSFVLWGLAHGLLLSAEKALAGPLERLRKLRGGRAVSVIVTFHLVSLLWIPFRAGSLSQSAAIVRRIVTDFQPGHVLAVLHARALLLVMLRVGAVLGATSLEPIERLARRFTAAPLMVRAALALATIQLTLELRSAEVQPFIYFQF